MGYGAEARVQQHDRALRNLSWKKEEHTRPTPHQSGQPTADQTELDDAE
jgi:hypothetical protein